MIAPAPFRVVLDACVLFPFSVRDTLLRAAGAGFFQVYWSAQILDEVGRNLVSTGTANQEKVDRLLRKMDEAFPEAMVSGHEPLVVAMANQEEDRHVAAAAVHIGAQVIVTENLKDFRNLPPGIEAQSVDEFLCNLFDLNPEAMTAVLKEQAAGYKKPPRELLEIVRGLARPRRSSLRWSGTTSRNDPRVPSLRADFEKDARRTLFAILRLTKGPAKHL